MPEIKKLIIDDPNSEEFYKKLAEERGLSDSESSTDSEFKSEFNFTSHDMDTKIPSEDERDLSINSIEANDDSNNKEKSKRSRNDDSIGDENQKRAKLNKPSQQDEIIEISSEDDNSKIEEKIETIPVLSSIDFIRQLKQKIIIKENEFNALSQVIITQNKLIKSSQRISDLDSTMRNNQNFKDDFATRLQVNEETKDKLNQIRIELAQLKVQLESMPTPTPKQDNVTPNIKSTRDEGKVKLFTTKTSDQLTKTSEPSKTQYIQIPVDTAISSITNKISELTKECNNLETELGEFNKQFDCNITSLVGNWRTQTNAPTSTSLTDFFKQNVKIKTTIDEQHEEALNNKLNKAKKDLEIAKSALQTMQSGQQQGKEYVALPKNAFGPKR